MADSFHSARMSKLCLAHQRRKGRKKIVSWSEINPDCFTFRTLRLLRFCVENAAQRRPGVAPGATLSMSGWFGLILMQAARWSGLISTRWGSRSEHSGTA